MRSHLARNVYRRLLACHGLPPPQLPSFAMPGSATRRCLARAPRPLLRAPTRRTFFGVFRKPPRELKEAEIEPGYETLLKFRSMETENARPPPLDELTRGFREFFTYKVRHHRAVNSTQAFCALRLLDHLVQSEGSLSLQDLRTARDALLIPPKDASEDHLELSRRLYEEIRRRALHPVGEGALARDHSEQPLAGEAGPLDFNLYLTAVSRYGGSIEASSRLYTYWAKLQSENQMYKSARSLWVIVIRGLAKEGRENELLEVVQRAEEAGVEYGRTIHEVLTKFYASRDRVSETKRWFTKSIQEKARPLAEAYSDILRFSVRNGEQKWLQPIFEDLCNSNPEKEHWDVIFQWAVLVMNKDATEIERMMDIMITNNPGKSTIRPDAATLNGLLKAAMEQGNPLLAERLLTLCKQRNVNPDATTLILQMDYRLDANDLSGANSIYEELQYADLAEGEDLPVINRYIRTLCSAKQPDMERILDITGAVEQRQEVLEPDTVVALSLLLLKNDQHYDLIDTYSLHTVQYSLEEREVVRKALVDYCLDKANSTARIWDGYSLLRQFFPETEPKDRIKLMEHFFDRKRPDMACYVFGHMRAHNNPSQRPTADVYVRCLEGLGRCPEPESLKLVHNMLKMDTTIQMSTELYNGLMIAYTASGDPSTALDFWADLTNSIAGPSYNSLAIIFQACESIPLGDEKAAEIWARIQRLGIAVPLQVYTAYCGAIAARGRVDDVKKIIGEMESSTGSSLDQLSFAVPYNALPGQALQREFEEWAAQKYPEIWTKLVSRGRRKTVEGVEKLNITRRMKA